MMKYLLLVLLSSCFLTNIVNAQKGNIRQSDINKPFVLGVIDEFQSTILGEKRILNIYLPEGYDKSDTTHYPVTYLLDGSADEDFIHVAGLYQFNSFEWINRVPKTIVVGIGTIDRRRDFTYPTTVEKAKKAFPSSGQSQNFIAFIEKELQPFVEKKYRTTRERTIIGQSLGGLLATEILLKKPALFTKYLIVSPSLWWGNGTLIDQRSIALTDSFAEYTAVYLAVGKEGLTPGDQPRVMEVDVNLLAEKLRRTGSKHLSVYFDYLPEENHATIMHQAVSNGLRKLYPNKRENQ